MNAFFEKPIVKFVRILVASLIVSLFISGFIHDAFKCIWTGCFIFIFYYIHDGFYDNKEDASEDNKALFFTNKFSKAISFSIAILVLTTLVASVIYGYIVSDRICTKGSLFYSEKQCAVQNFEEKYFPTPDDSSDNNF